MERKGLKRINAYIPIELHKELENIAKKRHMKMTGVIIQALINRIAWEKKYD